MVKQDWYIQCLWKLQSIYIYENPQKVYNFCLHHIWKCFRFVHNKCIQRYKICRGLVMNFSTKLLCTFCSISLTQTGIWYGREWERWPQILSQGSQVLTRQVIRRKTHQDDQAWGSNPRAYPLPIRSLRHYHLDYGDWVCSLTSLHV